jgi:hypothetical protein
LHPPISEKLIPPPEGKKSIHKFVMDKYKNIWILTNSRVRKGNSLCGANVKNYLEKAYQSGKSAES